jgi:hypothetical protein
VQPLLPWKSNKYFIFWLCVCSLSYPSCNAHTPYCHLWSLRLYYIFSHYLTNGTVFERKLLIIKCVFRFSVQNLPQILLILRNEQHIIINVHWSSCKVLLILSDVNKICIFQQVFERYSNIKFHENSSSGSLVVPCGRTDGHGQANRSFLHFCGIVLKAMITDENWNPSTEHSSKVLSIICYGPYNASLKHNDHTAIMAVIFRDFMSSFRQNASITSLLPLSTYCLSYQGLILLINADAGGSAV